MDFTSFTKGEKNHKIKLNSNKKKKKPNPNPNPMSQLCCLFGLVVGMKSLSPKDILNHT